MQNELVEYLRMSSPEGLFELGFEYAVGERWELLTLVVAELKARTERARSIREDVTTKKREGIREANKEKKTKVLGS